MRLPPELEHAIEEAVECIATQQGTDLRDPAVRHSVIRLARESYRAGVVEMQEPLRLEQQGPWPWEIA